MRTDSPTPTNDSTPSHDHAARHPPIAIIGGGNMARAIYEGARAAGAIDPSRIMVADPDAEKRACFACSAASAKEAIRWLIEAESNNDCTEPGDHPGLGQVILAIKPQVFPAVAQDIRDALAAGPERVVISILAGTRSASIRSALGGAVRIVRVMPNTPAQVRRGISAISVGDGATPDDTELARTLMSAVGEVIGIDESMMDAFTGLAGSGPAYVFYLAEALAKAGETVGFDPEQARRIAESVLTGSAALLEADGRTAAELRRAVTSPNGTTQAGTETLDAHRVMEAVADAVSAARDRGRQLSGD